MSFSCCHLCPISASLFSSTLAVRELTYCSLCCYKYDVDCNVEPGFCSARLCPWSLRCFRRNLVSLAAWQSGSCRGAWYRNFSVITPCLPADGSGGARTACSGCQIFWPGRAGGCSPGVKRGFLQVASSVFQIQPTTFVLDGRVTQYEVNLYWIKSHFIAFILG